VKPTGLFSVPSQQQEARTTERLDCDERARITGMTDVKGK